MYLFVEYCQLFFVFKWTKVLAEEFVYGYMVKNVIIVHTSRRGTVTAFGKFLGMYIKI